MKLSEHPSLCMCRQLCASLSPSVRALWLGAVRCSLPLLVLLLLLLLLGLLRSMNLITVVAGWSWCWSWGWAGLISGQRGGQLELLPGGESSWSGRRKAERRGEERAPVPEGGGSIREALVN